MNVRFSLYAVLGMLFLSAWPASPRANQLETIPQDPAENSFLLVASKQITDPRFRKTVIVVSSHGKTGHIGVIINRPQDVKLDEIFPELPKAKELDLYYGGPVYPGQISYLLRGGDAVEGALTLSKNIYLAYDMSALSELLSGRRHYKDLRVMYGLASWAPGQLELEIKVGGWYVIPFDESAVFDRPAADIWQELYNRANSIVL